MKDTLEVFMEYAGAFEETYKDDDWSRLAPYFAEDAVYEVRGGPLACLLEGREAILAGLKKSLDGLDRRCDQRHIDVLGGPEISTADNGGQIALDWQVRYIYGDLPEVGFKGRSVGVVSDGVITLLRDEYTEEEMMSFGSWVTEHNVPLDGSYV